MQIIFMKNLTTILLCALSSISVYSQETSYQMTTTSTKEEFLKYSEINGSPYLDADFKLAKATCCNETLPMRYNTYADEIEYKKDGMVYILQKGLPYSKIQFSDSKQTIVLETVNNTPEYFILSADGKNQLLKKVSSKIQKPLQTTKKPASFVEKDDKSSFIKNDPVYYIKTEKNLYKAIKSKKDVLDLYPDKVNELDKFFDINRIKFNKEESLVKLVSFLNQ